MQVNGGGGLVVGFFAAYPGSLQSVPGSELLAFLEVLRHAVMPFHYFIDCKAITDGFLRGKAWCTAAERTWAHFWGIVWTLLEDFGLGPEGVTATWVPAHTSMKAVAEGRITAWHRECNATMIKREVNMAKYLKDEQERSGRTLRAIVGMVENPEEVEGEMGR